MSEDGLRIRIERGDPDDVEIAAVVAALCVALGGPRERPGDRAGETAAPWTRPATLRPFSAVTGFGTLGGRTAPEDRRAG